MSYQELSMRFARLSFLVSACLLAAGCSTVNTGSAEDCSDCCCCNTPAAVTYSAPVVVERRAPRRVERALRPAPTLPCAPGYCPQRKARRDRN